MLTLWRRLKIAFLEYRVEKAAKRFFELRERLAELKVNHSVKSTDTVALNKELKRMEKKFDAEIVDSPPSTKLWN